MEKHVDEMEQIVLPGAGFDLIALISGEISKLVKRNMNMIVRMGESCKFGVDMSKDPKAAVESFLKESGLRMTEFIQFGEKLDLEPFYCIVEAEKL